MVYSMSSKMVETGQEENKRSAGMKNLSTANEQYLKMIAKKKEKI